MKVIVLAGLVSVEKAELSQELTQYFAEDRRVAVIDNIARLSIDEIDRSASLKKFEGDLVSKLPQLLGEADADVVIVALSEQVHPEKLFLALDDLREQQIDWDIYTIAMIDTRTCDCFPNVREALELYADASVMLPYQLEDVLNYVDPT